MRTAVTPLTLDIYLINYHLYSTTYVFISPVIELLTIVKCVSFLNNLMRSGRTVVVKKVNKRVFCSGLAGRL